jgi:L-arabinose isomerase
MKPLERFDIWLVTGSQGLYGPEVIDQVGDHAAQIGAGLDAAACMPVNVVTKPVVTTPEAIEELCEAANADARCVGVVAWMHTFSPAKMWIAGLLTLRKPLLHLHTQFNRDLPWSEIDMDFMNLNQSAHGDREFAFILTRLRTSRTVVVGHWQDEQVAARIGTWSRAASALQEARRLRIARFGDNMRHVAVTEGDKVEAQIKLGVSINTYGVADLAAATHDAGDADVDALTAEYVDRYDVVDDLLPGGDRHDALRDAARIEVGLRSILAAEGARAFTDTFEDLADLPHLPGIAVQRLMADGYGFGAEGDWKTALLVRVMKVMAEGLDGGTSFMEDYTYHLGEPAPKVLGAHMLEVCPSISGERPRCEIHPLSIGGKPDPVRLVFTAATGPGLVIGLADLGTRLRLVANQVDLIEPDAPLPRLPVARAVWQPRPDFATAAASWLLAGGPHHTCLSTAVDPQAVHDFADMAEVELIMIDAATAVTGIKNELRWNHAYFHLASGV